MELTMEHRPQPQPAVAAGVPVRLAKAGPSLWRVLDRRGRVIGHLQAVAQGGAVRFRARRFHAARRAFLTLGEFWTPDDAIDCIRFAV